MARDFLGHGVPATVPGLNIQGVSLHSYPYSEAERALQCGYLERLAQQALGHNSKAVHHA